MKSLLCVLANIRKGYALMHSIKIKLILGMIVAGLTMMLIGPQHARARSLAQQWIDYCAVEATSLAAAKRCCNKKASDAIDKCEGHTLEATCLKRVKEAWSGCKEYFTKTRRCTGVMVSGVCVEKPDRSPQPGMKQPGMKQSGMKQPSMKQPGMKQPLVKPGVQAPSRTITKPKARPNRGVDTSPLTSGASRVCTDPAARSIDFRIVNKTSRFKGRVEITGTIKNVGRAAYETRPNQQSMHLFEGTRLVKTQAFGNLFPGRTATIRYQRNWNSSSSAEGEFPPTYKLMIIYDPDITKDGNPKNDDCVGTNNKKERSGAAVNEMLR